MTDVKAPEGTDGVEPTVAITVDSRAIAAKPGELIIEAAERAGIFIPRFCYHPRMEPVGMCRMCLVEVSSPRGFSLQPACFLRVNEGMEVLTSSEKARKAQEGVIEFLLVNHPLDCPVCDKGGECPLQDQSLSHGPGESRFIEEKRHWAKPIEIGELVSLDRERCIQCARCTRFADEVAGDAEINFAERGDRIEVAPFPTKPFNSYFSGNTVQICPVGALTARPYRFKARPWDLEQVESTCTTCAVGCRHVAQSSAGALVRFLGVDSDPVNQSWLCDKGRFGFESLYSDNRVAQPMLRRDGQLAEVRWHEALSTVSAALKAAPADRIAMIGGSRFSNEDAYAWAKLAKSVLGTDSVDAQLGDGLPAETVLGLPSATIDEACSAGTVLLLAPDLREELPVLYLRLRDAARKSNTTLVEASPVTSSLSSLAAARLAYLPGEAVHLVDAIVSGTAPSELGVAQDELSKAKQQIGDGSDLVVVLGRPSLAESGESVAAAAHALHAAFPGAKFLSALRRANVRGALDMGLAPGLAPGRAPLVSGGALEEVWGDTLPGRGRDTRQSLEAAASGGIDVLVLLGADPLVDFPDRELAASALNGAGLVVSLATHLDASTGHAGVVLPVPGDGERWGTTTNIEGRVSRLAAKVTPPGVAWAPWIIALELTARLGATVGADTLDSLTDEIARVAPAYAGVTSTLLAEATRRDGVVVPLGAGSSQVAIRPFDPIATPGITSVLEQGAPMRVGSGQPIGGTPEDETSAAATSQPSIPLSTERVAAQRLDSYSQRLVLRRSLYDEGTLVSSSPSLSPLAPKPTLSVHPSELARLGLSSGDSVRVRSSRGAVVLETVADPKISRHVVATRLAQAGGEDGGMAALLDVTDVATDVRLETL